MRRFRFGQDPYTIRPSTYNLLMEPDQTPGKIYIEARPNLLLVPANVELFAAEYQLLNKPDRAERLRHAIQRDENFLDFILIDTPPNLNLLTVNGLVAAGELLIPVAANYLSMRGVRSLLDSVRVIRDRINPDLKLLGVLPTLVHSEMPHAMAAIAELQNVFKTKVFKTFIPLDDAAAAAPDRRKTALEYQPDSAAAAAYQELANEVNHGSEGSGNLLEV